MKGMKWRLQSGFVILGVLCVVFVVKHEMISCTLYVFNKFGGERRLYISKAIEEGAILYSLVRYCKRDIKFTSYLVH
jgi:hypothetical protein